MGVLVTGSQKVEKRIRLLKMNLRTVTDEANARIRPTWKTVQKQVGREARALLRRTHLRGRRVLKEAIEGTIRELEKFNRRL